MIKTLKLICIHFFLYFYSLPAFANFDMYDQYSYEDFILDTNFPQFAGHKILELLIRNCEFHCISVFGDSHCKTLQGIPFCNIHHLGPMTMHRVGRDGQEAINLGKYDISDKGIVVFVFGEIDVRCHIGKQRDSKERDLNEIIHTLATHYIYTIEESVLQFHQLYPIVCSVAPPSDFGYSAEYPRYGSLEDRVQITKVLNETLKNICEERSIAFLDVYDGYSNPDGTLRFELSDQNVHIRSECNQYIKFKLYEIIEKIIAQK